MLKISILVDLKKEPFGGGNQFLKALRKYFIKKGVYINDPEKADVIIFNSFPFGEDYRFKQAYKLKKKGKILVHRVDGPIFKYRNRDLNIDEIIYRFNDLFTDGTIFQSHWSKMENSNLKMKINQFNTIIPNAPDEEIFNSKGRIEFDGNRKIKLIATSWSSNWKKGFKVYKYLDDNLDFSKYKMTFIGNSPVNFKNIEWIKPLKSKNLAEQLKYHDIYITASQNDPCSNSLIEALHCGLPAVGLDEGGHPEIIINAGITFKETHEIIQKIDDLVKNYKTYQNNINLSNIKEIGEKYFNFIKKIHDDYKKEAYTPKKSRYLNFLKLKYSILKWKIKETGLINLFLYSLASRVKNILTCTFTSSISDSNLIEPKFIENHISELDDDVEWLYNLKENIQNFLNSIKGKKRDGFYQYSLTGDVFGEKIKWGLGNSVFFLKIVFTLGLEKEYQEEIKKAINFILSFQRKNGSFYDPLVRVVSFPLRIFNGLYSLNFANIRNKQNIRAETRQAYSSLSLFNISPQFEYRNFPKSEKKIDKYLKKLDWEEPWGAGSHFSHLLFFLQHSKVKNKKNLIEFAINCVNKQQHEKDGFWYKGNPSFQQKINGAMKIITGLKVVNRIDFKYPKKIIDNLLFAKNDEHACDNFNIVYVLKYCSELTNNEYRYSEIKDFMYERLKIYKQYYFPERGGFSFNKNQANRIYYGAYLSKGKNEPDIHGTVMFLWGISIIVQILNLNKDLQLKEFIT